jgi:hypothetical protein
MEVRGPGEGVTGQTMDCCAATMNQGHRSRARGDMGGETLTSFHSICCCSRSRKASQELDATSSCCWALWADQDGAAAAPQAATAEHIKDAAGRADHHVDASRQDASVLTHAGTTHAGVALDLEAAAAAATHVHTQKKMDV